jgi:Protein of unknown function (DUF1580)
MAIDLRTEAPLSYNEAGKLLDPAPRPSTTTWWRWSTRGVHGVVLETIMIGGRRYTTAAALQRFIDQLSDRPAASRSLGQSPRMRRLEQARTERELNEAGI